MKPAWQPQPAPPAQTVPGVNSGPNGRPPGGAQTPMPQAGNIQVQGNVKGLPPQPSPTYAWKSTATVYPELTPGRLNFNPISGEWVDARG